jgi:hypothetical protein
MKNIVKHHQTHVTWTLDMEHGKDRRKYILHLNINKWVYSKLVWQILSFERRLSFCENQQNTKTPSEVSPYPSDLDEIGCELDGKTRPVVFVMLPRPEKV